MSRNIYPMLEGNTSAHRSIINILLINPSLRTKKEYNQLISTLQDIKFFKEREDLSLSDFKLIAKDLQYLTVPAGEMVFEYGKVGVLIPMSKQAEQNSRHESNTSLDNSRKETEKSISSLDISRNIQLTSYSSAEGDGRDIIITRKPKFFQVAELSDGGSFGELALISNKPRMAGIRAITDSHFAVLSKGMYENILGIKEQEKLNAITNFFLSTPYFKACSRHTLGKVQYYFIPQHYLKGQQIYKVGDEPKHLYLVKEGEFEMTKTVKKPNYGGYERFKRKVHNKDTRAKKKVKTGAKDLGKLLRKPEEISEPKEEEDQGIEVKIKHIGACQVFGEEEILCDLTERTASITCHSMKATLYSITLENFNRWVRGLPGVMAYLHYEMALKSKTVSQRLAQTRRGGTITNKAKVWGPLTQRARKDKDIYNMPQERNLKTLRSPIENSPILLLSHKNREIRKATMSQSPTATASPFEESIISNREDKKSSLGKYITINLRTKNLQGMGKTDTNTENIHMDIMKNKGERKLSSAQSSPESLGITSIVNSPTPKDLLPKYIIPESAMEQCSIHNYSNYASNISNTRMGRNSGKLTERSQSSYKSESSLALGHEIMSPVIPPHGPSKYKISNFSIQKSENAVVSPIKRYSANIVIPQTTSNRLHRKKESQEGEESYLRIPSSKEFRNSRIHSSLEKEEESPKVQKHPGNSVQSRREIEIEDNIIINNNNNNVNNNINKSRAIARANNRNPNPNPHPHPHPNPTEIPMNESIMSESPKCTDYDIFSISSPSHQLPSQHLHTPQPKGMHKSNSQGSRVAQRPRLMHRGNESPERFGVGNPIRVFSLKPSKLNIFTYSRPPTQGDMRRGMPFKLGVGGSTNNNGNIIINNNNNNNKYIQANNYNNGYSTTTNSMELLPSYYSACSVIHKLRRRAEEGKITKHLWMPTSKASNNISIRHHYPGEQRFSKFNNISLSNPMTPMTHVHTPFVPYALEEDLRVLSPFNTSKSPSNYNNNSKYSREKTNWKGKSQGLFRERLNTARKSVN